MVLFPRQDTKEIKDDATAAPATSKLANNPLPLLLFCCRCCCRCFAADDRSSTIEVRVGVVDSLLVTEQKCCLAEAVAGRSWKQKSLISEEDERAKITCQQEGRGSAIGSTEGSGRFSSLFCCRCFAAAVLMSLAAAVATDRLSTAIVVDSDCRCRSGLPVSLMLFR